MLFVFVSVISYVINDVVLLILYVCMHVHVKCTAEKQYSSLPFK